MLVWLKDGSAQRIVRAATLRLKLQIRFALLLNHSVPSPVQPVLALTFRRQAPGMVTTTVHILSAVDSGYKEAESG